jgi:hypothetical protein
VGNKDVIVKVKGLKARTTHPKVPSTIEYGKKGLITLLVRYELHNKVAI